MGDTVAMQSREAMAATLLATLAWLALSTWTETASPRSAVHEPAIPGDEPPESPARPRFTVYADSGEQLRQLSEAVIAFSDAGLDLPALEISFKTDASRCGGAKGLFMPGTTPWRISICDNDVRSIIPHELAHAWERANVGDDQREAFVDLLGLENWRDHNDPWNSRGIEWAAIVIQQGVYGIPLPPALSDEAISRLEGFELLTGRVAPTLVEWVESRVVPCPERPTALSGSLTDAGGNLCVSAGTQSESDGV
jgi:hypothetical protein